MCDRGQALRFTPVPWILARLPPEYNCLMVVPELPKFLNCCAAGIFPGFCPHGLIPGCNQPGGCCRPGQEQQPALTGRDSATPDASAPVVRDRLKSRLADIATVHTWLSGALPGPTGHV